MATGSGPSHEGPSTSALTTEEGSMTYVSTSEGERLRAILAWDGKVRPTEFVGGTWGEARTVAGLACPTFRVETDAGIRNGVLSLERLFEMEQFRSRFSERLPKPMFEEMAKRHAAYMAVRRFYPDSCSTAGFLGWEERLEDVIAEDAATLQRLGVTHAAIGRRLKQIFDAYASLHEASHRAWLAGERTAPFQIDPVDIEGFRLHRSYTLGFQECPFEGCSFRHGCAHGNCGFTIGRSDGSPAVSVAGMSWHLIGDHRFFEGKSVPYRVEPEPLVDLLFGKARPGHSDVAAG